MIRPTPSTLERSTPPALDWARSAARSQVAAPEAARRSGTTGAPSAGRTEVPPAAITPPADALAGESAARGAIPATTAEMYVLTSLPEPGSAIPVDQSSGLGRTLSSMFGTGERHPSRPTETSDWSNANDMRLVLPVMRSQHGPWTTSIESLPGRNQHWATVQISGRPADDRLNFDGLQGGVRLGVAGGLYNPNLQGFDPNRSLMAPMHLQWAEFRVGAEGLVFTGQIADGSIRLSGFDLEEGFFKTKVDGLGRWAGENLAVAIPLGIAGAGAAAFAVNRVANMTGEDIALPISMTVFERNGFRLRPTVRPVFGASEFLRFGGADLGLGYRYQDKLDVTVRPGWNLDPTNGPTGPRVSARAVAPIKLPGGIVGTAGIEGQYRGQGDYGAFVGIGLRF